MCLIYQNKSNPHILAFSHTLKVGHIDCIKDTRIVLEKTIGEKINDGCKALFGKYIVINKAQGSASIHEEPPFINQVYDRNFISLQVDFFITGDLAFYVTIPGKENMGGIGALGVCYQNSNGHWTQMAVERNGLLKNYVTFEKELKTIHFYQLWLT